MIRILFFVIVSFLNIIIAYSQTGFGQSERLNEGWLFTLSPSTDDLTALSSASFDDSSWRRLSLPHDWSIEAEPSPDLASCTGYLPGGVGWYRKHFKVSDSKPCHFIYFEGVYNRSEVYLNGHLLGKRPNGYVSFAYDLTPYLTSGDNILLVKVDHSRNADSRWYTGSGIYRDVYLVGCEKTHFALWGVGVVPKGNSFEVTTRVDGPADGLRTCATLYDHEGNEVAKTTSLESSLTVNIEDSRKVFLWSVQTPYLYTMVVQLMRGGKVIDETRVKVGLRSLSFDADKGFCLNGKSMKVKGVCLHHDAGVLGAAVPKEVWRRRLLSLKEMGANAIRMSHNMQATDLYDLCDELGFLVMDEGSDEWEFPKRKWLKGWNKGEPGFDGTYDFFEEWIERDITDMVLRDRNHPSVFLWSVGNEVDYPNDPYSHPILDGGNSKINQPMYGGYKPDAPDAGRIGKIAKRLAACIRKVDTSRPVTGALAGVVMSNETEYPEAVDVVGYNYTENRYAEDHKTYPKRILYGSETSTNLAAWKAVRDNDYIFGQFVWTGMDYLGESGAWPSRGLGTGLLDFTGFMKPRGWFFRSLWNETPNIYIGTYVQRSWGGRRGNVLSTDAADTWNYRDGQTVRVVCYTNVPRARLLLNGSEVGEMKPYDDSTGMIHWDVPYAAGTLVAEGCDKDGKVVCRYEVRTVGEVSSLRVTDISPDKDSEVRQILVEAVDEEGRRVASARNEVACELTGTARLLGLENGNNGDMSSPKASMRRLHNGRLVAYIKGKPSEATFRLVASGS
ncbi:MAG: DUF4982 domain-containing protein [Bacteroidaceae bacterium]|nr:DUF4982 domain-containing protein [Bacteroidaceae bacterium]